MGNYPLLSQLSMQQLPKTVAAVTASQGKEPPLQATTATKERRLCKPGSTSPQCKGYGGSLPGRLRPHPMERLSCSVVVPWPSVALGCATPSEGTPIPAWEVPSEILVSRLNLQAKKHAPSFRALVLINVGTALCAAFVQHVTKPCMANRLAEVEHPVVCAPQWLPMLVASNSHEMQSRGQAMRRLVNPGCTARFEVSGEVNLLPDTASFVPTILVDVDGTQIGFPVDETTPTTSCDQIAAIAVSDKTVRGVSFLIKQGFSLGFIGTAGEPIEFKYWNGLEKKEYFVQFQYTMETNGQLGRFDDPFELVVSEAPFCRPCESGCSYYSIDVGGVSVAKVPVGAERCVENAGACELTVSGETRTCYDGGLATSPECYTPCAELEPHRHRRRRYRHRRRRRRGRYRCRRRRRRRRRHHRL